MDGHGELIRFPKAYQRQRESEEVSEKEYLMGQAARYVVDSVLRETGEIYGVSHHVEDEGRSDAPSFAELMWEHPGEQLANAISEAKSVYGLSQADEQTLIAMAKDIYFEEAQKLRALGGVWNKPGDTGGGVMRSAAA